MAAAEISVRPSAKIVVSHSLASSSPGHLPGLLSYSYICGAGPSPKTRLIEIPEDRLRQLLSSVLSLVDVDEAWYLATNPDVAEAVKSGDLSSARAHYQIAGFFEDRLPYRIDVDETWYQTEYPDVKQAIRRGSVDSCQEHFNMYGFREGRVPYADWSLLTPRPSDL